MSADTQAESAPPIDYASMAGAEMLNALGDDASKWAAAFRQMAVKLGYSDMDEEWLIGWFGNAIEHSHDVRHSRSRPPVLPDGSSFFVG